jgi:hypothetical protein
MPIPGADTAVIPPEKIIDYLLNLSHPVGGSKARWFLSIGYDTGQPDQLADDLKQLVRTSDDFVAESTSFGVKCKVKGPLTPPTGQAGNVVSVWIVETGTSAPRLVAVVPD